MIEGERRERIGASGKHHDADTVVGPVVDESLDDGFDRLEAVEAFAALFVILGEH